MSHVSKRPQVIRDLIELATYIAEDNLEASDRFLAAAETTFKQLVKMPGMGKSCQFSHPNLAGVRHQAIKGCELPTLTWSTKYSLGFCNHGGMPKLRLSPKFRTYLPSYSRDG